MKIINSKLHGVLDYLVGAILIISPWLFGFANSGAQTIIPVILGIGAILYSLVTKYELGIFKLIPFRIHLIFDILSGIFLASSPWLFGFADDVHVPHLIFGILEIGVALLTNPHTSADYNNRIA